MLTYELPLAFDSIITCNQYVSAIRGQKAVMEDLQSQCREVMSELEEVKRQLKQATSEHGGVQIETRKAEDECASFF